MKITITLMAALAISTAGCGSASVSTGNNANSAAANTAAKAPANANTSGASNMNTTAATAPAGNLPAEIKVGNDTYKLVPTSDAKLNPGVLEKYFKGLTGDKVRMDFYDSGSKKSPVMVGTYASEAEAKKAMEQIDADADDVIWTKGNLLIVTDNEGFANKL